MDFNFDFNLVQSQKLLLTPQLKQALEILTMNSQELFEFVEEQLEANPVLDMAENEGCECASPHLTSIEQLEWENEINLKKALNGSETDLIEDINELLDEKVTVKLSLKEYLLFQLHTSNLNPNQIQIGEYLLDNIDENGYLAVNLKEVAAYFNVPTLKVSKVLEYLQTFDPPGICARNLKECLLIQLRQMGFDDENVKKLIEEHLDDLAANRISAVTKSTGLSSKKVNEILSLIKTLEPKPGREFYDNDNLKLIIPDILVKKMNHKFETLVNEDAIPNVNINKYYRQIVEEDISSETRKFIQNKISHATWLIKCIEYRKEVLIKVARCIVKAQEEFFQKGKKHIKPLDIGTISEETGFHELVINKALNGKYMECAWGIFDMRHFLINSPP